MWLHADLYKICTEMVTLFSAAFFVRTILAVTFAVTTKFLTNTFSTVALEIAEWTFYRQNISRKGRLLTERKPPPTITTHLTTADLRSIVPHLVSFELSRTVW